MTHSMVLLKYLQEVLTFKRNSVKCVGQRGGGCLFVLMDHCKRSNFEATSICLPVSLSDLQHDFTNIQAIETSGQWSVRGQCHLERSKFNFLFSNTGRISTMLLRCFPRCSLCLSLCLSLSLSPCLSLSLSLSLCLCLSLSLSLSLSLWKTDRTMQRWSAREVVSIIKTIVQVSKDDKSG